MPKFKEIDWTVESEEKIIDIFFNQLDSNGKQLRFFMHLYENFPKLDVEWEIMRNEIIERAVVYRRFDILQHIEKVSFANKIDSIFYFINAYPLIIKELYYDEMELIEKRLQYVLSEITNFDEEDIYLFINILSMYGKYDHAIQLSEYFLKNCENYQTKMPLYFSEQYLASFLYEKIYDEYLKGNHDSALVKECYSKLLKQKTHNKIYNEIATIILSKNLNAKEVHQIIYKYKEHQILITDLLYMKYMKEEYNQPFCNSLITRLYDLHFEPKINSKNISYYLTPLKILGILGDHFEKSDSVFFTKGIKINSMPYVVEFSLKYNLINNNQANEYLEMSRFFKCFMFLSVRSDFWTFSYLRDWIPARNMSSDEWNCYLKICEESILVKEKGTAMLMEEYFTNFSPSDSITNKLMKVKPKK